MNQYKINKNKEASLCGFSTVLISNLVVSSLTNSSILKLRCQQRKTSFLRLSPIKETPGRKVFTDLSIYVV